MGGKTNFYYEDQSGLPAVVSDNLVQSFDKKICDR
jgi:hypothetical protein